MDTPTTFEGAFLNQLRAEHATAVKRAEQATREAERLTLEAERLAGVLEAAQRFISEVFVPPSRDVVLDVPVAEASVAAQAPEIDRATSGFVLVPGPQSVTLSREESWKKRLKGMTQKQALVAIAKHEGGVLDVTKARDIFLEAGLTQSKEPKSIYGVIHTLLRASDQFEKAGTGAFRLIAEPRESIWEPQISLPAMRIAPDN